MNCDHSGCGDTAAYVYTLCCMRRCEPREWRLCRAHVHRPRHPLCGACGGQLQTVGFREVTAQ